MKYCTKCGHELVDEAVICVNCGCSTENTVKKQEKGYDGIIKAFLIVGTVISSLIFFLIPLAWCLPITIICIKKLNRGEPISMGFKICILLFVSLISGILLLCKKDD